MQAEGTLPPILHVQDCISARAAVRLRDEGAPVTVVRTVHHVDDFTTPELVECQLRRHRRPDRVRREPDTGSERLAAEYGVGRGRAQRRRQRALRRRAPPEARRLRAQVGARRRFLVLTVGGIEPRKGSDHLFAALALLRGRMTPSPVLAVIGGHSFQDHRAYRESVLAHPAGAGPGARQGRGPPGDARRRRDAGLVPRRGRARLPVGQRRVSGSSCWRRWRRACRPWSPTFPRSASTSPRGATRWSSPPGTTRRWPSSLSASRWGSGTAFLPRGAAGRTLADRFTW